VATGGDGNCLEERIGAKNADGAAVNSSPPVGVVRIAHEDDSRRWGVDDD
jgi:hypothetical protein